MASSSPPPAPRTRQSTRIAAGVAMILAAPAGRHARCDAQPGSGEAPPHPACPSPGSARRALSSDRDGRPRGKPRRWRRALPAPRAVRTGYPPAIHPAGFQARATARPSVEPGAGRAPVGSRGCSPRAESPPPAPSAPGRSSGGGVLRTRLREAGAPTRCRRRRGAVTARSRRRRCRRRRCRTPPCAGSPATARRRASRV